MKKRIFLAAVLLIGLSATIIVSCKKDNADPDQVAFDAADGIKGARLYDHVLNQKDYDNVTADGKKATDKPDFFRCKSCHGWDLKGRTGVLINKASSATYPEVANVNLIDEVRVSDTPKQIFDAIKNVGGRDPKSGVYDATMPDYSKILTDADIWDLVKFIKETAHQTNDFYTLTTTGTYPTGTKTFSNIGKSGDAAAGLVTYNSNCMSCHGADGTAIDVYCKGIFLGDMFRGDPHEIQHKAIWGMPNDREHVLSGCTSAGQMPAQTITDQDIRNMMVMGQDVAKFPGHGAKNQSVDVD